MKKVLIAGIGNIFHGDDGFGCKVARELQSRDLPAGVIVRDFGIRSHDLAYALTDGCDVTILVDATSQDGIPGTLYLIEPDFSAEKMSETPPDAHSMNPATVLQLAQSLGTVSGRLFLVGCEPKILENDDGELGMSETVQAAIPAAIEMIESLVTDILSEKLEHEVAVLTPA